MGPGSPGILPALPNHAFRRPRPHQSHREHHQRQVQPDQHRRPETAQTNRNLPQPQKEAQQRQGHAEDEQTQVVGGHQVEPHRQKEPAHSLPAHGQVRGRFDVF